jgi:hypothetical protein
MRPDLNIRSNDLWLLAFSIAMISLALVTAFR